MEKYPVPSFITTQHVLEDISHPEFYTLKPHQLTLEDHLLQTTYNFHQNIKRLQSDVMKQSELNSELQELNHKLVKSIVNLKTQSKN